MDRVDLPHQRTRLCSSDDGMGWKNKPMNILHHLLRFEAWFNRRFGWFFTNGRKHRTWK